ncbi:MAG: HutP family protein [Lachnospiraceae bacterium]
MMPEFEGKRVAEKKSIKLEVDADSSPSWAAQLLAMTRNLSDEQEVKKTLIALGFQCVVTELGGKSTGEFQEKSTRAVIGACINENLVHKTEHEVHALLHATEEAKKSLMSNTASIVSLAVKMAIVRKDHWISVAMYGNSSLHPVTAHDRSGLGTMHI